MRSYRMLTVREAVELIFDRYYPSVYVEESSLGYEASSLHFCLDDKSELVVSGSLGGTIDFMLVEGLDPDRTLPDAYLELIGLLKDDNAASVGS